MYSAKKTFKDASLTQGSTYQSLSSGIYATHQPGLNEACKPPVLQKAEWAGYKVRDVYLDIIEAIAYASWLRSKISAHRLSVLAKSLTICDVANVQQLARRLLLETLGFWHHYEDRVENARQ